MKFVSVSLLLCLLSIPVVAQNIELVTVFEETGNPILVTHAGDGSNRLFIVNQSGSITVLQRGASVPTTFLNISSRVVFGGEQGLLGLAFHPQYAANGRFFVNYTRAGDGATVIAEYGVSADRNVASNVETVILTIAQPFANHNGGMIAFGPDGYLYIATGDGGSGNDPGNRAQNIDALLGKMLRIDVDNPAGTARYSSPSSNPFFGSRPGRDEIWSVGLRNPWRFSFDRETGDIWIGDVGQGQWEEIDFEPRGSTGGTNYGWRVYEGNHCTGLDPALCNPANYTFPVAEYFHSSGRCSVTGGYVYRGTRGTFPPGTYLFADYCTGEIFVLNGSTPVRLMAAGNAIASFGEDESGELYVVHPVGSVKRLRNRMTDVTSSMTYTRFAQPCRVIDTRSRSPLQSGFSSPFRVAGAAGFEVQGGRTGGCGVPTDAAAAVINFIAVNPTAEGNLRGSAYPLPVPLTGTIINYQALSPPLNIANAVAFPLCDRIYYDCAAGDVRVQANGGATHLVADVVGYFRRAPVREENPFAIARRVSNLPLTSTCSTLVTIPVHAPAGGTFSVRADLIVRAAHISGAVDSAILSLSSTEGTCQSATELGEAGRSWVAAANPSGTYHLPFTAQRSFIVPAGTHTIHLNGYIASGSSSQTLNSAGVSATFLPD